MRVISGKYKGKKIEGFHTLGTRPTMDRVKESLFAMIQGNLKDTTVLDLFAGSGSLGIEALSNGAKECYFIDHGREIGKILKQNLEGIEGSHFLSLDYREAINHLKREGKTFDIVFLDPPYQENLITPTLHDLPEILKENSLLICEYETEEMKVPSCYQLWKEKQYGEKKVSIYKYLP